MGSKAAPPLADQHSSPAMAASTQTDNSSFPIYISSDEDDDIAVLGVSRNSKKIQIQLDIDPSTPHSGTSKGSIPDRKGKRKVRSELPLQVIFVDDIAAEVVVVDDDDDDDSLILIKVVDNGKRKTARNGALFEVGECSRSATTMDEFHCTICTETVAGLERFHVPGCAHAFCASCVRQYIAAKIEQNLLSIGCPDPDCKDGVLHPEECRHVIPPPLFDRWGAALCETAIGELKFYCPFTDCSALLVDDTGPGDAAVTNVECPHCNQMFCVQCKVPWHDGVDCAEFQQLGKDERGREDLLLRKVAQERKWQRCPKCKMYVERTVGCKFMRCRCGHSFCYLCGSTTTRGGHSCSRCRKY